MFSSLLTFVFSLYVYVSGLMLSNDIRFDFALFHNQTWKSLLIV